MRLFVTTMLAFIATACMYFVNIGAIKLLHAFVFISIWYTAIVYLVCELLITYIVFRSVLTVFMRKEPASVPAEEIV